LAIVGDVPIGMPLRLNFGRRDGSTSVQACARSYGAGRATPISGRNNVRRADPEGREIDCTKREIGFSLIEAKRHLEALPDNSHGRECSGDDDSDSSPSSNVKT